MKNKMLLKISLLAIAILAFFTIFIFILFNLDSFNQPKSLSEPHKDNQFGIFTTTDMHGRIWDNDLLTDEEKSNCYVRASTLISQLKEKFGDSHFLIDNGDCLQGTEASLFFSNVDEFSNFSPVSAIALTLSYIGYDLVNLGNHFFEYPYLDVKGTVIEDIKNKNPHITCANLYDKNSGQRYFDSYYIKKIPTSSGEITCAVIGLVTPDVPEWVPDGYVKDFQFYSTENTNVSMSYEIKKVQNEIQAAGINPDMCIVATHSGFVSEGEKFNPDKDYFTDFEQESQKSLVYPENTENQTYRMIRETSGIDMFVCGHDHTTFLSNTKIKNKDGKDILTVNAGCNDVTSSVFSVDYDDDGNKIINIDYSENIPISNYDADNMLLDLLNKYRNTYLKLYGKLLGVLKGGFEDGSDVNSDDYAFSQTDTIDLINRSILYKTNEFCSNNKIDFCADLAMICPFATISSAKDGNFYEADNYALFKYANLVSGVKMTGQEIKDLLEYNASERLSLEDGELKIINDKYTYSVFYGLNFTYDMTKPAGNRVNIEGLANGNVFDLSHTYSVATTSYFIGNTANSCLANLDGKDLLASFDDIPDVHDAIRTYIVDKTIKSGAVYNTNNSNNNNEYATNWKIIK